MAVLGVGGILRLRRELPDAVVVPSEALHARSASLLLLNQGYWSGDLVTLISPNGLPLDPDGTGASCPDGHAMYAGSIWEEGGNRSHILDDRAAFYSSRNLGDFYVTESAGLQTKAWYFIYRDKLDRVSFYTSKASALRGSPQDRIPLRAVDFGALTISLAGANDYETALTRCVVSLPDRGLADIRDEVSLRSICEDAPSYESFIAGEADYDNADVRPRSAINQPPGSEDYANAYVRCSEGSDDYQLSSAIDSATGASLCRFDPSQEIEEGTEDYANASIRPLYALDANEYGQAWLTQGHLSEWSLNLSANEIDTTAVGERFGDAIKSIVSGGGTLDFQVQRSNQADYLQDSTALMRLLLMVDKGCKAEAQFWMINNRSEKRGLLPGDLFYETNLMVTSVAISTRPDEIIAGTLNFVTVGEIALRMGTN